MIYTIGHALTYRENLRAHPMVKVGRGPHYPGGYAFRTRADAEARIAEAYAERRFAVFGLLASWEWDTVPSKSGWWHHLRKNAEIVEIDPVHAARLILDRNRHEQPVLSPEVCASIRDRAIELDESRR